MRTIKPLKQSLLQRCIKDGDKDYFCASIVSGFRLGNDGNTLLAETDVWSRLADALGKDAALDDAMPKSRAEFIAHGSFFAPGGVPVPAGQVEVRLGSVSKRLNVFGDRYWTRTLGVASGVSEPQPISEMPISFAGAFGGADYARNPLGKGLDTIEVGGEARRPLPNIEHPQRLVGAPDDHPEPASFGPVDPMWPQRLAKAGTYDEEWQRTRFPGLAADTDWTFFNVTQEDQWLDAYLTGDETFEIINMHPQMARITGALPGIRSRCFINREADGAAGFREIKTHLDTVLFIPAAELGVIIWRGVAEIATSDAADIDQILVAYETLSAEARDLEHYRNALAKRLDPDHGYLLLLDERDLIPPGDRSGLAEVMESVAAPNEGLMARNQVAGAQERYDAVADELKARGLDPAAMLPPRPVAPGKAPAPDTIDLEKIVTEARDKQQQATRDAEARLTAMAAQSGEPLEALRERLQQEAAVLPRLNAQQQIDRLHASYTFDAALEAKLREAEQGFLRGYRLGAHVVATALPAAYRARTQSTADHIREQFAAGRSLAGQDLAGVELAGAQLAGADFSNAYLEFADFSDADLSGANFSGAILTKARLCNSRLDGACFEGANVGDCDLSGASLVGADCSRAVLSQSRLVGADLSEARLVEALVLGADFKQAIMDRIEAPGLAFHESDFSGARLAGANLANGVFLQCKLQGAGFTGATLTETLFIEAELAKADFGKAEMPNVRMLKDSKLRGANFEGANLDRANLRGCDLHQANFRFARLDAADLSECDLGGADFYRATARQAKFMKADLEGANMVSINLMQGMLDQARLVRTDLRGSNLYGAELMGATVGDTRFAEANLKMTKLRDWAP